MAATREGPGFRIAVFDEQRGNAEGREEDKVLAFWPPDTPPQEQIVAVGLVQAMAAFMGTFAGVRIASLEHCLGSRSGSRQNRMQPDQKYRQKGALQCAGRPPCTTWQACAADCRASSLLSLLYQAAATRSIIHRPEPHPKI